MPENIAIRASHLGKQYRLGEPQEQYLTFRDVIVNKIKAPLKAFDPSKSNEMFWALKDVSFDVEQGDVVGIIGRNGAGKSTLLKILSRITTPTEGTVELYGRVGSLLEVGTGFHPEMTGRENIYLNGSILGMKKLEIDEKFDEIVRFSEIEKFLDTPVKRYSSGMYVRLAFAVAAHLDPEILLVDEVLAVGDAQFQKKCLGKMNTISREGRTILFVSHNMSAISSLCEKCIWLEKGKIREIGDTKTMVQNYYLSKTKLNPEIVFPYNDKNVIQITHLSLSSDKGIVKSAFFSNEAIILNITWCQKKKISDLDIAFCIYSSLGIPIFSSLYSDVNDEEIVEGMHSYSIRIPGLFLIPGQYHIDIGVWQRNIMVFQKLEGIFTFSIEETGSLQMKHSDGRLGLITMKLVWERN